MGLAALDHLLTATVSRSTYEHDLRASINRFRWVEYSVSAALMIILISFYSGITGINAVICIAGAKNVPGFVYGIVLSEVALFFSFGLNQWLQYRRIGKSTDYAYSERTYLVLSLVAESLLAWQIFGGSLAG